MNTIFALTISDILELTALVLILITLLVLWIKFKIHEFKKKLFLKKQKANRKQ